MALEDEGSNPSAHPNIEAIQQGDDSILPPAPIAQRTRAPVFGTGGRGFESL